MRAFLPVDYGVNRSHVHVYEGAATLVDTRVVCIRPNITALPIELQQDLIDDALRTAGPPVGYGDTGLPTDLLDQAVSSHLFLRGSSDFPCQTKESMLDGFTKFKYHPSDWNLTVCQLDNGG